MLFDDSVPDGVAVSEAMAIAETFEDEKSKTFVNGVFDMTAIVYFVCIIIFFLFLSVQSLEKRRYN